MIIRALATLLLGWILGFAWFAIMLPQPLGVSDSDVVVVLTGGPGRIDRGLVALERHWAKRMLISGVDREVRPAELAAEYAIDPAQMSCCIDLGFRAVDTRSNAVETARWVRSRKARSIRLITTDWHMRRAQYELERVLDPAVRIEPDAVASRPSLGSLFREYNKYLLRRGAGLFGV